jgi:hypothetical protein
VDTALDMNPETADWMLFTIDETVDTIPVINA